MAPAIVLFGEGKREFGFVVGRAVQPSWLPNIAGLTHATGLNSG